MIVKLRPHHVFDLLSFKQRLCKICLPQSNSLTSMLERAILVTLVKLVQPNNIFEFGTFLGEGTFMLAENSEGQIYTMDLGDSGESILTLPREIKNITIQRKANKVFYNTKADFRIHQLFGDSTKYDFSKFTAMMDFVVIDGGHSLNVVKSDTENAFLMLKKNGCSCVVWHDYTHSHYEITNFLNNLSKKQTIFHVEDTYYAFYLSEKCLNDLAKPLYQIVLSQQ
jgi:hypothetical protein